MLVVTRCLKLIAEHNVNLYTVHWAFNLTTVICDRIEYSVFVYCPNNLHANLIYIYNEYIYMYIHIFFYASAIWYSVFF